MNNIFIKSFICLGQLLLIFCETNAEITVNMNTVSPTMTLKAKETGEMIYIGEPRGRSYTFNIPNGDYLLTAYSRDGETVNGSIYLEVTSPDEIFDILTQTYYVTNKKTDGSSWTEANGDYTTAIQVRTREGKDRIHTPGKSETPDRGTFLALNGDSYYVDFIPSLIYQEEGFGIMHKFGTLTGNITIGATITEMVDFQIKVPKTAKVLLGEKRVHYTDFSYFTPESTDIKGNELTLHYRLVEGLVYNYRISKEGGITNAGYFTLSTDPAKRPNLIFSEEDFYGLDPKEINHDVKSNNGFETGDLLLNINKEGFLQLKEGEVYSLHAMRSWQLTDNSTNNYFIEPDFHYAIYDLQGNPNDDIISISSNPGSAWADIKGLRKGTVIVLVTYDGIRLDFYSGTKMNEYMGGEHWGGIWPENTGVFVVSVGEKQTKVIPEFLINEEYNQEGLKLAGPHIDSEHDVFYFIDEEKGYPLEFNVTNTENIEVAYPNFEMGIPVYYEFNRDGITKNEDGSYKVLLKEGRQIVKITDNFGNSTYQVLTAKKCDYDIINLSNPYSQQINPGDEVGIQFTGLRHPANKLSGIYNMSAYICYDGIPNGSSLILSGNQYTFGSNEAAQLYTVMIPENDNGEDDCLLTLINGVIQVNGYGDPIGNHRNIIRTVGRSPNFTAVPHQTYFGRLPDIKIYRNGKFGNPNEDKAGISFEEITPKAFPLEYMNIEGIKSSRPFHGLNIIKMSDGTWQKKIFTIWNK